MTNISKIVTHTKKLSILFVEDHEELRMSTTDILKSIFNTVESCTNGQEALEKYIEYKNTTGKYYDIVLSDIEMPLMNGIDLTKNIYKENKEQVVIIISAFDDAKYLLKLINIGIEQFIKKPIDSNELLQSFLEASKKIANKKSITTNDKEIFFTTDTSYSLETKSINKQGENIYLTKFEIIFIELLATSFGKIYTNEDIVSQYTTCGESIDASNIRKLVSKLRKKLPKNSLESIYAIGYKFSCL